MNTGVAAIDDISPKNQEWVKSLGKAHEQWTIMTHLYQKQG
ncbi:hypothetical protein [Flagellimonas ochracea]|nr:hypothetical protein [Allomuricauda ochracea]